MTKKDLWSLEVLLKDLLMETDLSYADMAKRLGVPEWELHKKIRELGLGWIRKGRKKTSRGHGALAEMMQKLLPNENIEIDYHLGERLFLDIYCPGYQIGAEYHGRQHFHFTNFFYDSPEAFKEAQERDARKEELCKELGIALIIYRYDEALNEDLVFQKMIKAIDVTPRIKEEKKKTTYKGNHYYEEAKRRNREYRKKQYREYKRKSK